MVTDKNQQITCQCGGHCRELAREVAERILNNDWVDFDTSATDKMRVNYIRCIYAQFAIDQATYHAKKILKENSK